MNLYLFTLLFVAWLAIIIISIRNEYLLENERSNDKLQPHTHKTNEKFFTDLSTPQIICTTIIAVLLLFYFIYCLTPHARVVYLKAYHF